jgi:hypothetical protein
MSAGIITTTTITISQASKSHSGGITIWQKDQSLYK